MSSETTFKLVMDGKDQTVLTEYNPLPRTEDFYQSEAMLENRLIDILDAQGIEYVPTIKDEKTLIENLRAQMERLNEIRFSEDEWDHFFKEYLAAGNDTVRDKTFKFQRNHRYTLQRDNGDFVNLQIVDKENIHRNSVQVINQYVPKGGSRENRYDVTILVNGLPLVQIELKRRGRDIRDAFNQIDRYIDQSFWSGSGLYDWLELFIISNGTETKYYSNTTRQQSVDEQKRPKRRRSADSGSFQFTSYWADARNLPIWDLEDFTRTFLNRRTLLNVLTRYLVLTEKGELMAMRPYQIAATERVLNRILITESNPKRFKRTQDAQKPLNGGYVWHTTGSGKTLTSFKTSQLASQMDGIDKVLFVVDRKDLDYQTIREYDRFEKGAANSNKSTKILERQLSDPNARIIVTTIQKLDQFIKKNKSHPVYDQHVVLVFDECHRSQFGEMHQAIVRKFKKHHLFGFTGTPIFAQNTAGAKNAAIRTTEQTFGDQLHTYTIVDAIRDENVLGFRVDYVNTIKEMKVSEDEEVEDIEREEALLAPERIKLITGYILDHFDQQTNHRTFNSILATQSIDAAKSYYAEFKKQQEGRPNPLKTAVIYSYSANPEVNGVLEDEPLDTDALNIKDRDFLDQAIKDYNKNFGTAFSTEGNGFDNYYKDLSKRMKNKELDLLIVVNMFLTGFDAKTLNTLWVDKKLKLHGLIQAFSRTNRILNSVKNAGNIVVFRNLEQRVNDAIALFGDRNAGGLVILKPYPEWLLDYENAIAELKVKPGERPVGEKAEKAFIETFGKILRLRNILSSWDQFEKDDKLSERDLQDYQSIYISIWENKRKKKRGQNATIDDDLVFEVELVKQTEIGIDQILELVAKYHEKNIKDKEVKLNIMRQVDASPTLRSKKDLIEKFIETQRIEPGENPIQVWSDFIVKEKNDELERIIEADNLQRENTTNLMDRAFNMGYFSTQGDTIMTQVLPKGRSGSLFGGGVRKKREKVATLLSDFFDRYNGILPILETASSHQYQLEDQ